MKVTLILSLIMMAAMFLMIFAAVAYIQSKKLFGSAPKDIQAAILEREERFAGARIIGWILLVISILAFPCAFIYGGWDGLRQGYSFGMFTARFLAMLYLPLIFDIVFLDWFLLIKSHFYQHYYPETEGCAGFHQFGFNRKEKITSIILYPFIALFLAWICTLLQ